MENNNNSNEPIILGTLRKEKSSKPLFVFIVLALIIGVTFALPELNKYVSDPNTVLGSIYNSIFGVEELDETPVIDNDAPNILNNKTMINYKNIQVSNVAIVENTISYNIKSTNEINLNAGNYYFEIYGSNHNFLERFKLNGNLITSLEERTFTFNNFRFNSGSQYFGKIVELTEDDYSEIVLNSDESGIASITCTDEHNTFEYIFDNYKLKNIKHQYMYNNTEDINLYLEEFQKYSNKSTFINGLKDNSSVTEEIDYGFRFTANIDLNVITKEKLATADNIYYYELDKLAKIINYDMKVEGFSCR